VEEDFTKVPDYPPKKKYGKGIPPLINLGEKIEDEEYRMVTVTLFKYSSGQFNLRVHLRKNLRIQSSISLNTGLFQFTYSTVSW